MTAAIITLIAALTIGVTYRLSQGRVRAVRADGTANADLAEFGITPGARGTVVEVTTPHCSDCAATHRVLSDAVREQPGVALHQLPGEDFPAALRRWNVMQAPTTFIFDRDGSLIARVGGLATRSRIETALEGLS